MSVFFKHHRVLILASIVLTGTGALTAMSCKKKQAAPPVKPYFSQTTTDNCVQTTLKMALKYYHPDLEFSFEKLNQMTHHVKGQWTWPLQCLKPLLYYCLDVHFYATTPLDNLTPMFLTQRYGKELGEQFTQRTNWTALPSAVKLSKALNRYSQKKLFLKDLETAVNQGHFVTVILKSHQVVVVGFTPTHVIIHDPALGPDIPMPRKIFVEKWNSIQSDNDAMIIRGLIPECNRP